MIKIAAKILKRESGSNNFPVLIEIFKYGGYKELTINNVKKILSISN